MKVLVFTILFAVTYALAKESFQGNRPELEEAEFRLARQFGDHMVLPASPQDAIIWGYGESGQVVHILFRGTPYLTEVNKELGGKAVWSYALPSTSAGGPYSIAISSQVGSKMYAIVLRDVLFGDVWLCGGQSNMQFTVGQAFAAAEEFNFSKNYPHIRLMSVQRLQSNVPLYDLQDNGVEEPWTLPSQEALYKPIWSYFSAICWMFGRRLYDKFKRPIGLISSNWGGTPIEAWSSPDVLKQCNVERQIFQRTRLDDVHGPHESSVLWNAMIHPFLQSNLFGVIWYQGEDNAYSPDHYHCLFPAMIKDWRNKWHQMTAGATDPQFPFGFVQLAPNGTDRNLISGFPVIRFAQTAQYGYVPNPDMPKTFMAVAMDLPDIKSPFGSIHPRFKSDVADRLFLGALSIAYKQNVVWKGPIAQNVLLRHVVGPLWAFTVNYDPSTVTAGGLDIRNKNGFEVLLHNKTAEKFTWKPIKISFNNRNDITLYVEADNTTEIQSLRYSWRAYPCLLKNCAIYDKNTGLPSPPWIVQEPFLPKFSWQYRKVIKNYL